MLFCISLTCLSASCVEKEKTTSGTAGKEAQKIRDFDKYQKSVIEKVEKETIVITTHVKNEAAKFDVKDAAFPFGPVMRGDEVVIVFRGNPTKKAKATTVNLRTSGNSVKSGIDTTKELITR